jgi:hypothetical protein
MPDSSYELKIQSPVVRRTTTAWLQLGLVSLVAAGVFSILLVLARTPVVQELIPLIDFFRVALVVHVTLSVLIWLLAMSAAAWSLSTTADKPTWDRISFWAGYRCHYYFAIRWRQHSTHEQLRAGVAAPVVFWRPFVIRRWHLQSPGSISSDQEQTGHTS